MNKKFELSALKNEYMKYVKDFIEIKKTSNVEEFLEEYNLGMLHAHEDVFRFNEGEIQQFLNLCNSYLQDEVVDQEREFYKKPNFIDLRKLRYPILDESNIVKLMLSKFEHPLAGEILIFNEINFYNFPDEQLKPIYKSWADMVFNIYREPHSEFNEEQYKNINSLLQNIEFKSFKDLERDPRAISVWDKRLFKSMEWENLFVQAKLKSKESYRFSFDKLFKSKKERLFAYYKGYFSLYADCSFIDFNSLFEHKDVALSLTFEDLESLEFLYPRKAPLCLSQEMSCASPFLSFENTIFPMLKDMIVHNVWTKEQQHILFYILFCYIMNTKGIVKAQQDFYFKDVIETYLSLFDYKNQEHEAIENFIKKYLEI